ncbi:MAG: 16S rRNA (cytosine(1402)-N(4))-methyltransferase [Candidatus Staskawiczbacteria bacterium RIFCSPHIGHO2_02_FULL_34_9]|uniref:Ribosomal RNA small subunit methyltransferase H n=1 Tax=Candidatus Staskawiczbacteria bacterium RIFCSPHIGHO2_02_FULL_34_9 TaxID=1802206 RepID=A0A1G2HYW0_9BACT|nr:MAG: 16S rRNA (cytosine(1402)-N(4))-methyltransferase [Candidatus Staskawiczbacteria bacterium RIFCSPHIGHO2_02_FULL_34_9]
MTDIIHTPVLEKEVLNYLDPKPNENFIDCTVGEGGHSVSILEKSGPNGMLLGIDLDSRQVENSRNRLSDFKERVILQNDSYVNMKDIVVRENFKPVNGILIDLGYSSWQIEQSKRGFSFSRDELLDMRYDMQNTLTAEKIVNEYPENELQRILRDYGEEKFFRQIASRIVNERQKKRIESTKHLIEVIRMGLPPKFRKGRINFATKTFQALRIEVNGELDNLKKALPKAIDILAPGGRLAVISFHSLEDRIVKNFLKDKEKENLIKISTKKPIIASSKEVFNNPRSRSAKLRSAIKI